RIQSSYDYINTICGKSFSPEAIHSILQSLRFEVEQLNDNSFAVLVPSNKADVRQPADLAEEILRIDGLDQIPVPDRMNIALIRSLGDDRALQDRVANLLCGIGFHEIVTN